MSAGFPPLISFSDLILPSTEFTFCTTPTDITDHGEVVLWHDCECYSQHKIKLLDLSANS